MLQNILRLVLPKFIWNKSKEIWDFFYKKICRFSHIYNPEFNNTFDVLYYERYHFLDLLDNYNFDKSDYQKSCLITCIDRKDQYLKNNKLIFESWVNLNNSTFSDNFNFLGSHSNKITKNLFNNKSTFYNKKIFVFPYYSNQFGHFIGENLGSMLFFLDIIKKKKSKEKVLIVTPHKNWDNFFKKEYSKNIIILPDKSYINKNIYFLRSKILPKLSPPQNYIISKNILAEKIINYKYKDKKVFLTSKRSERILNIKEVINFLKKRNFLIINPKNFNPLKLFRILNSARIVISESGAIVHNLHIARNNPYYLLISKNYERTNKKWYRLTHVYNNFHAKLSIPIYFETSNKNFYKIPYQDQIIVDLKKIDFLK